MCYFSNKIHAINNPTKKSSLSFSLKFWFRKTVRGIDLGIDTTLSLRQRSFVHRIGFRFLELRFRMFEGFVGARFRGEEFGLFGGGAVRCFGLSSWKLLSLFGLVALQVLRRHCSGSVALAEA